MTTITDAELYRYAYEAFGDLGRDIVVIIGAIGLAESHEDAPPFHARVDAEFDNVAHGFQPEGSPYQWDRGWPQINSIHGFDATRLLRDPAYAAACARSVYNRQGFQAWSTFKGGQFRAFISRMELAADAFGVPMPAADVVPPPFSRDDLMPLFFQLYGYHQQIRIEPEGYEADGRRRYQLVMP